MGWRRWRARRAMREPVRGDFRMSGEYFANPGRSSFRTMLTGVVTAPGVPPTAVECPDDRSGRRIGHDVLPVLVDRSDPTRFLVLWEEITKPELGARARRRAEEEAARMRSSPPGGGGRPGPADGPAYGTDESGAPAPEWVRSMIADLGAQGLLTGDSVVVDGGTHVIDLTRGHLSATEAADLGVRGIATTATVLSVADVSIPHAALPGGTASLCDLDVRVDRPAGGTYGASIRLGFRTARRRAAIAAPGVVLPVRVDPADETRVAVDVDAYDARHPGA